MILGRVTGEAVLLARCGQELFAIGAECTHYHGPLVEGVVVEDTVRCTWHHACFSLRTGEALRAPALNPVPCSRVGAGRRDTQRFARNRCGREDIYTEGILSENVRACMSCHGDKAEDNGPIPRLAEQHQAYLARQLEAFQSMARANEIMHENSKDLTAEQISEVTAYLATL